MLAVSHRGPATIKTSRALCDAYKVYLKENPIGSSFYVPLTTYTKVCKVANNLAMSKLITGEITKITFPSVIGKLEILKVKMSSQTKLRVDWNLTNKLDMLIYHENEHSNSYYCKFKWFHNPRLKGHTLFKFRPMRRHKRALASAIKNNQTDKKYMVRAK